MPRGHKLAEELRGQRQNPENKGAHTAKEANRTDLFGFFSKYSRKLQKCLERKWVTTQFTLQSRGSVNKIEGRGTNTGKSLGR